MLQRVTELGGYLNYPSGLIRQAGEEGEAGGEGEELAGALRLQPAHRSSAGACLRRGREEEEGGEGVLLPFSALHGGGMGQAL